MSVTDPAGSLKHSGPGIASFVIFVVGLFATIAVFAFAGYIESTTPGGMDAASSVAVVVGAAVFGCGGLLFIGLILGIVGLFQSDRRRVFAGLGVALNGLVIVAAVWVIWLGITYAQAPGP